MSKPSSVAYGSRRIVYLLKIGANLSEMEVRTFVRIQRVIWDRLLVLRLLLAVYTCRWLLKRRNEEIKIGSRTEVSVLSNLTGKMTMDEAVKQ